MALGSLRRDWLPLQAAGHSLTMWRQHQASFQNTIKDQIPIDFSHHFHGNGSARLHAVSA